MNTLDGSAWAGLLWLG